MITDSFDKSDELITVDKFFPKYGNLCSVCLVTFSDKILHYVESNFKCKKIGRIDWVKRDSDMLIFENNGKKIGIYCSNMGAPAASVNLLAAHRIAGPTKFIMFGSAGSLNEKETNGKYVIPTMAYRDEGLSYHYMEPSDYIELKNNNVTTSVFTKLGVPFIQGKIWTTDAVFMETKNKYMKHVEDGCLAVDMETSAIQATCDYFDLELYSFLQTGDVLSPELYTKKGLAKANHQTDKLYIALEIADQIS